jgi:hypothetical protein
MKNTTTNHNNFSEWARKVRAQKSDVLELMLKSDDALDRAIAKDIVQTAGGCDNA